jgi:hypothetical protein
VLIARARSDWSISSASRTANRQERPTATGAWPTSRLRLVCTLAPASQTAPPTSTTHARPPAGSSTSSASTRPGTSATMRARLRHRGAGATAVALGQDLARRSIGRSGRGGGDPRGARGPDCLRSFFPVTRHEWKGVPSPKRAARRRQPASMPRSFRLPPERSEAASRRSNAADLPMLAPFH